ncbi:hypothetical protein KP509_24G034300 [Ceratopteris richardii]|nr:hypothetical protein KP509_24G034300 [Ceratopteris richardii]KAH7299868.1 hypothetical protein KP509_24G034300 [Ceratopteris richardii]KAH7299869.1 hypothetical protein KP509_24G034300 [Ceratopteris richardii]
MVLVRISRASQFDAAQMDQASILMLKEQLKKVFSMMPDVSLTYEPELMACLLFCVWRFSIWMDKPTPGNASRNLCYRNEPAFQSLLNLGKVKTGLEAPPLSTFQKIGFLLLTVGVPYCWARLQTIGHLAQGSLAKFLRFSDKLYKISSLANLMLFLNTGRYLTLVDRLLRARLVYQKPNRVQVVSSEFFNRQLVWQELSELLLFVLPHLKRVQTWLQLKWGYASTIHEKEGACALCGADPITIPYVASPCGHVYCYYCLTTGCQVHRSFHCVRCNREITSMRRLKTATEASATSN